MQGEHSVAGPKNRGQYQGFQPSHLAVQTSGQSESQLISNGLAANGAPWAAGGTPRAGSFEATAGPGFKPFTAFGFSAGTDYNSNSEGSPASSGSSHRFRQPSQELHTPALSVQGVKQSRPSNLQGPMSNGSLSLEQLRARSGPLQEVVGYEAKALLDRNAGHRPTQHGQHATPMLRSTAPDQLGQRQVPGKYPMQFQNQIYNTDTTPLQSARHPPASSSLQQVANSHTQLPHHLQPPQQPNFNAATPQSHPQQALPRQQQQPGTAQSSRPTSASQNRQSVPHRAAAAQARPSPYGSESEGDGTPQSSRQSSPQKAARQQQQQQQQHAEANHTQEEQMPTPSVANVGSLFDPDARDRHRRMHSQALGQHGMQTSLPSLHGSGTLLSGILSAARDGPSDAPQLASLPVREQEELVVEDLLLAFLGLGSSYALPQYRTINDQRHVYFIFCQPHADASVVETANRLLCICEYVAVTEAFCERGQDWQAGLVCQGLTEALGNILQSWRAVVTKLHTFRPQQRFTLLDLHWHMEQYKAQLQVLAEVCGETAYRRLHGAALLSYLHSCASSCLGDDRKQRQLEVLMAAAAKPYFTSLTLWLDKGRIHDPHEEFMIVRNQVSNASNTQAMQWETEYALRTLPHTAMNDIPSFLEDCKGVILPTGKYVLARGKLNGPAQLSGHASSSAIEYDGRGRFKKAIHDRHAAASAALLSQLRDHLGLGKLLRGAMDFVLLGRGDFLVTFLDAAEEELLGPCPSDAKTLTGLALSLQAVLEQAVRATAQLGSEAMLASTIRVVIQPLPKSKAARAAASRELGGIGSTHSPSPAEQEDRAGKQPRLHSQLALQLEVPWPLSVVVNAEAQQQYAAAFRHLFALKCAERRLCTAWRALQLLRVLHWKARDNRGALMALPYCHSQMHLFHMLLLFGSFEVLEPLWQTLSSQLESSCTLEEVLQHHASFLTRLHAGWLLSRSEGLSKAMDSLIASMHSFCDLAAELETAVTKDEQPSSTSVTPAPGDRELLVTREIMAGNRKQRLLQLISEEGSWGRRLRSQKLAFDRYLRSFVQRLEEVLQQAQRSASESREETESIEALLDRLRAAFMGMQKGIGEDLVHKLKYHDLRDV